MSSYDEIFNQIYEEQKVTATFGGYSVANIFRIFFTIGSSRNQVRAIGKMN
jgi:hypothetical protein